MRQHFLNGRLASALTACSCYGYVFCRLYRVWAGGGGDASLPLLTSPSLCVCLLQVKESTVYLYQAEGPGSSLAF